MQFDHKVKCPHCNRLLIEIDANSSFNRFLHPQFCPKRVVVFNKKQVKRNQANKITRYYKKNKND